MDARVIVEIIVDFSAPAVGPPVALKECFPDRRRVERARKLEGTPIEQKWPKRVVGNKPAAEAG
jgi:hypothetical protein